MPLLSDNDVGLGAQSGLLTDQDVGLGQNPVSPNPAQQSPSILGMAINDIARLPGNIYQGIKSAFTLPHDVMTGQAAVPQSANFPGGEDTSAIPRVTSLASMTPISPVESMAGVRMAPTEAQLKSAATSGYNAAGKTGVELEPAAIPSLFNNFQKNLNVDLESVAPKTYQAINKYSKIGDDNATVMDLRRIQKTLGEIKNTNADPAERKFSGMALNTFNGVLENLDQVPSAVAVGTPGDAAEFSQLIKEANGNYSAYKQSQNFTQRGNIAENNTAAANSGLNLENNLRSQVKQILNNPKLQRGLDDETLQALKDFNGGTGTANTMRIIGNLFGGGGGLGMLAAGGVGHLLGIPPETLPATGAALKSVSNQMAANKFGDIGNMIRSNSPLFRQGVRSISAPGILGRLPPLAAPLGSQSSQPQ